MRTLYVSPPPGCVYAVDIPLFPAVAGLLIEPESSEKAYQTKIKIIVNGMVTMEGDYKLYKWLERQKGISKEPHGLELLIVPTLPKWMPGGVQVFVVEVESLIRQQLKIHILGMGEI